MEEQFVKMYGKTFKMPRTMLYMTDGFEMNYNFSRSHVNGITSHDVHQNPLLLRTMKDISNFCGNEFNSLLINKYSDGNDSVAYHADDSRMYGDNITVASLSLYHEGADLRKFQLKSNKSNVVSEVELPNGSLLIMHPGCQEKYKHAVPKEPKKNGVRYNITFRKVVEI